ncbi:hypothetical protein AB0I82_35245 [Streptomyces sp. NPDC050315]|uniref:hypothetical protein n=1 Tax=Streptomyces sp. NPDC050315 TaxID=3155039 RepID=UPI0034202A72
MSTSTDSPPADAESEAVRDLKRYLLWMFLALFLLVVGAAVYLCYQHPRLAEPLGAGGTVASVLLASAAVVRPRR